MRWKHSILNVLMLIFLASASFAQEDEYVPGYVLIKLKEQYREYCSDTSIAIPQLVAAMESIQVEHVSKRFPQAGPLTETRSPQQGVDRRVDLSLIYQVRYTGDWPVSKAAQQIARTGVVEYAEPWFIPKLILEPNDVLIDSLYHLPIIRAFEAWDVDTGSSDITIAIIDTGVDFDHPDIEDNLWENQDEIPNNGLDDDGNGYIDDHIGWNFFDGNNDINETGFSHGTHVAGLAGASTNNAYGMAGTGYSCKIMGIKSGDKLQLPFGYDGIVYAAENGADVINCSWGSFGSSQFSHDVVKYATYNLDAILLGGAGNDNRETKFFPASFPEVVSVGSSDILDQKSDFSNYNYDIDILAPGTSIFSLKNDTFGYDSGTSMSSPIAAGAAGIVRSRFPQLSALQVREQLRVTADASIYSVPYNLPYTNKLGSGRIDMFKAVDSIASPGLRIEYFEFSDNDDEVYVPGEQVNLGVEVANFLLPIDDVTLTIESISSSVKVVDGTWEVGTLLQNGRLNNLISPFTLEILDVDSFDVDATIKVTATSSSSSYTMEQFLSFVINPSYVNVNVNNVKATVTQNGLVGFTDIFQSNGIGFQLENHGNLVYEAGLMIGYKDDLRERVVDRVRSSEIYDRDFWQEKVIERVSPEGDKAYLAAGSFTDTSARQDEIGFLVSQRAYAYDEPGHLNYMVMEYTIENRSGHDLYDLAVGMFADWDINDATKNKAATAYGKRLGYVYNTTGEEITAGIQALGDYTFSSYMIDNVQGGYGGIEMYDQENYSSRRKYKSLTQNRASAGNAGEGGVGNDVIQVCSMQGVNIKNGESKTLAFAIHGGRNIETVLNSADSAYIKYFGAAPGAGVTEEFEVVRMWPNPASDHILLDIELKRAGSMTFRVHNSQGNTVRSYETQTMFPGFNSLSIDLPPLNTGNYFLEINATDQREVMPVIISGD